MQQLRIVFTVLITFFIIQIASSQNYCAKKLCRNNRTHIGCGNNGALSKTCKRNTKVIPVKTIVQTNIVKVHNFLRNHIAQGKMKRFSPAVRMATISWNEELANLARLNVQRCVLQHDQCRNTQRFRYAGQNGGLIKWTGIQANVNEVALIMIASWFKEFAKCNKQSIANLTYAVVQKCGHFTSMVQEKNNAIGCAILRHRGKSQRQQLLICNYGYNNIYNQPAYRTGVAASMCTSKANSKHSGLCSRSEKYKLASIQF